jgi:6-phosphogluconate dehydrogenase (decarboxylating)
MVHNGIEYADMQFIGEAYELLKAAGLDNSQMADVFATWNSGGGAKVAVYRDEAAVGQIHTSRLEPELCGYRSTSGRH